MHTRIHENDGCEELGEMQESDRLRGLSGNNIEREWDKQHIAKECLAAVLPTPWDWAIFCCLLGNNHSH